MKSINQIFKNNPDLMESPEVRELIDYCRELEGDIMENTQSEKFSFCDKILAFSIILFGQGKYCDGVTV